MAPKFYKAADVCELAQLQPYVLRSWEKEFPGIGVQKSPDSPRFYRQSDVDQVLRIKQLVFHDGLTLAGARRRLEGETPVRSSAAREDSAAALSAIGANANATILRVREGLSTILEVLSQSPGRAGVDRLTTRSEPIAASGKSDTHGLAGRIEPSGGRGTASSARRKSGATGSGRQVGHVKRGDSEEEFQLRPLSVPTPPTKASAAVRSLARQTQQRKLSKGAPKGKMIAAKRKRAMA